MIQPARNSIRGDEIQHRSLASSVGLDASAFKRNDLHIGESRSAWRAHVHSHLRAVIGFLPIYGNKCCKRALINVGRPGKRCSYRRVRATVFKTVRHRCWYLPRVAVDGCGACVVAGLSCTTPNGGNGGRHTGGQIHQQRTHGNGRHYIVGSLDQIRAGTRDHAAQFVGPLVGAELHLDAHAHHGKLGKGVDDTLDKRSPC